jgi:hypothetical protein
LESLVNTYPPVTRTDTAALDAAGALAYNRASLGAAAAPLSFFL